MAAPLYLPDFRGGAIQVCRTLSAALGEAGHSVALLAGHATADVPVGDVQREMVEACPLWRVNLGGALRAFSPDGYRNRAAESSFSEFFAEVRPDLLHVHGLQGFGVGLLESASLANVPAVMTLHDWWWYCPCLFGLSPDDRVCPMPLQPQSCSGCEAYDFSFRREAVEAALPLIDRFLVPSEFLRDSLLELGLPSEKLVVSPNGTARPQPDVGDKESLPGILRVGFFGGAGNREKGLLDLGEAIRTLPLGRFQFLLYAVPREDLELNRSDVVHPPAFGPDELDRVCAGLDVLVVPSRMRESFSLATREAMVRGVPVIATSCGGPEEVLIDGHNGFQVPVGDSSALATVLQRLADDRPLEATLAGNARRAAEEFPTPQDQMAQTRAIYREVLQEHALRRYPRAKRQLKGRRVLFLSACDGAPLRYRVHHAMESLRIIGVESEVLHYAAAAAMDALRFADMVILFRTPFDAATQRLLHAARAARLPVVFSSDDLIFHPDRVADAPALLHPDAALVGGFRETARACALTASFCDAFIGSSSDLVAAAEDLGLPAFLLRNTTGGLLEKISRSCPVPEAEPEKIRMGYFSGTDTHDRDLEAIAPALISAMNRVPELHLTLAGPVAVPRALGSLGDRIEQLPLMGWSELPATLSRMDLNLAPLETDRGFNRAKSDVKFLEAALVGVPSVASPGPEFIWGTREGRLARLADTLPAWEEAVVDLAHNPERGRSLGALARASILKFRRPSALASDWGDALHEILLRVPESVATLPEGRISEQASFSRVDLEPVEWITDVACLAADSGEALADDKPIFQEIVCRHPTPRRIDIRFGTYGRRNPHQIEIRVVNSEGQEVGGSSLAADSFVDRAFVGVPVYAAATDGYLRVEIRSQGAAPGNEILVWRASAPDASLWIGDRHVPGESISFRVFSEMNP